jgi:hypothetical protein
MVRGRLQGGQERICVYQVVDPRALVSAGGRLVPVFAGRPEESAIHLGVSQDGGRWWFVDDRVLWRTVEPARLPGSSFAAEAAARSFIGRVGQAVRADSDLAALGIYGLFPDDLRPALITLVADPRRRVVDHWLVRFDAYLPTATSLGPVPVYGAVVDVCVGQDGVVGSFWLAWRPCVAAGLVPLAELGDASAASANGDGSPAPVLVYRLADEGSSQTFISPYYFVSSDADGDFFSASIFSPVAKIVDDPQSEEIRVMAAVDGGSGQYAYRWMSWDLTNPLAEYSDWGSNDGVTLAVGAYNVILGVTDLQTGSVVVVQRTVFTDMFASDGVSA